MREEGRANLLAPRPALSPLARKQPAGRKARWPDPPYVFGAAFGGNRNHRTSRCRAQPSRFATHQNSFATAQEKRKKAVSLSVRALDKGGHIRVMRAIARLRSSLVWPRGRFVWQINWGPGKNLLGNNPTINPTQMEPTNLQTDRMLPRKGYYHNVAKPACRPKKFDCFATADPRGQ